MFGTLASKVGSGATLPAMLAKYLVPGSPRHYAQFLDFEYTTTDLGVERVYLCFAC